MYILVKKVLRGSNHIPSKTNWRGKNIISHLCDYIISWNFTDGYPRAYFLKFLNFTKLLDLPKWLKSDQSVPRLNRFPFFTFIPYFKPSPQSWGGVENSFFLLLEVWYLPESIYLCISTQSAVGLTSHQWNTRFTSGTLDTWKFTQSSPWYCNHIRAINLVAFFYSDFSTTPHYWKYMCVPIYFLIVNIINKSFNDSVINIIQ